MICVTLNVEGPDRRRFRVLDAPIWQTVGNLAEDLLAQQYGWTDDGRVLVAVDHVCASALVRLNPDRALAELGLADGDELRIYFQSNQG